MENFMIFECQKLPLANVQSIEKNNKRTQKEESLFYLNLSKLAFLYASNMETTEIAKEKYRIV